MTRAASGLLLVLAAAGCGGERAGRVEAWIEGGQVDAGDRAVVAVQHGASGLCSGALVHPRAVLTARHCVGQLLDTSQSGGVVCGKTRFSRSFPATELRVSASLDVRSSDAEWWGVSDVFVPSGDAFCGNDLAVLKLADPLGEEPLPIRYDSPATLAEPYSAVGFGATDATALEYGVRRRRDGLAVACVGDACGSKSVSPFEWLGPEGTCAGDSGGPALDANGRLFGVVSRSLEGCSSIVYEEPRHHREWLDETLLAVEREPDAVARAHGGCSFERTSASPVALTWGAAAALAVMVWVRRRS